ncbi:MAG: low specificity L-threonine aldolase [Acidimicrobiia bacterium]
MDLDALPHPSRSFASDNAATVHPAVLDALARANVGHALAYGYDDVTAAADRRFSELFGRDVDTYYVWGGSGANVMALTALARPADAVICTDISHINVDETSSPERIVGAKLIDVPSTDGKLSPAQIEAQLYALGDEHHAQPGIVSITQATEIGTLYSPAEVGAIVEIAHRHGLRVHLDGARIANATAALGGTAEALRSFTIDAGVDVVSFGGTKNGMMYGDAVVFLTPELASRAKIIRKLVSQLPSKMRYISAQFDALLTDDLWLRNAGHANAMARRLYDGVRDLPGLGLDRAPAVNSLFPCLPRPAIDALQAWATFYDWDTALDQVRWMTAWDTSAEDVDRMIAGVCRVLTA